MLTNEMIPKGNLNFFSFAWIHNAKPILGVFVALDLAKYLLSLSKDELRSLLRTYYIPHLPNYDATNPMCQIQILKLEFLGFYASAGKQFG